MRKGTRGTLVMALLLLPTEGAHSAGSGRPSAGLSPITERERLEYIREAEVWSPIDTASLDLRKGPRGGRIPSPEGELACRFHVPSEKPSGRSPKFYCRMGDGKVHKIKYGADNKEIFGEVAGTRILWALGFYADHMQPVRLRCLDCPEDPWGFLRSIDDWSDPPPVPEPRERVFDPAVLEFYYADPIEAKPDQGVAWDAILELRSRNSEKAERQRIHREALTLLAGFMQHADSKASNQTLGCAPGGIAETEDGRRVCSRPVVYIGDIGGGGGYGWRPHLFRSLEDLGAPSKVGYHESASISVWSDPEKCIMRVYALPNATLRKAAISEEARRFLAERLSRLSHEQLVDLSQAARNELRDEVLETPEGTRAVTHEDRVKLVEKRLREEILDHRCPPGSGS